MKAFFKTHLVNFFNFFYIFGIFFSFLTVKCVRVIVFFNLIYYVPKDKEKLPYAEKSRIRQLNFQSVLLFGFAVFIFVVPRIEFA